MATGDKTDKSDKTDKRVKRAWFGRVLSQTATANVAADDDGGPAPTGLQKLRRALDAWMSDHAGGPAPDQRAAATKRLNRIAFDLTVWNKASRPTASDDDKKEALDIAEQIKVSRARIELAGQPAKTKALPNAPLLAWNWCEKNVDKGTLLDGLKKTLPAFEKAVAASQKTPSRAALEDAETKLGAVKKALVDAVVHYDGETGDAAAAKGRMAAKLVAEADKQAAVLAALKARAAEFDPATAGVAAKQALADGRAARTAPLRNTRDVALQKAQLDNDTTLRNVAVEKQQRDAKRTADRDQALLDAAGDQQLEAQIHQQYDEAVLKGQGSYDKFLATMATTLQKNKDKAVAVCAELSALADLSWATCNVEIPKKTPLHEALSKVLPAYEQARAAFDAAPEGKTLQAALDALWAVQTAVQKAAEQCQAQAAKLPQTAPIEQHLAMQKAVAQSAILIDNLRAEATLLQQSESELPQARIAKAVMEQPGGGTTLDAWMAEMGGQAKTPEDKARVRAALKARYGLETLEGEMTTKALPRLYDVLSRVPSGQTKGNDMLKMVVRNRSEFVPSGYYADDEQKMHLDVGRTGRTGLTKELFGFALPFVEKPPGGWKDSGVTKPKSSDVFDHLTLHEVGHAVDEQMGFMNGRMGNSAYGGWKDSSASEVRDIAGNAMGFYTAFNALPKAFLEGYLDAVLARADPEKDAKPANLLAVGDSPDWGAMNRHAGVKFCKAARMGAGSVSEVTQWDKKAKEAVHGGRVYQEAYGDTWVSYELSVRSRGVGGYQFRAPGEWFAEIYAQYYGGRLKSSHPDYAWMKSLVDTE